jgi:uncharacterized protein (TIGR03086 family)
VSATTDPRPNLARSLTQAAAVIAGIKADQLSDPTPCAEYDVATVINHLTGAIGRMSLALAERETPEIPETSEVPDGGFEAVFEAAKANALASVDDDGLLGRMITLPWATLPGAAVIQIYTLESVLHTWDIATATGQEAVLDDDLASALYEFTVEMLPATPRGGEIPFSAVVECGSDVRAVHKLAAYSGRRIP